MPESLQPRIGDRSQFEPSALLLVDRNPSNLGIIIGLNQIEVNNKQSAEDHNWESANSCGPLVNDPDNALLSGK
jgi:hypothetical protein